ncbi:amino acid adenylation domain-containing protein (plasmid) [Rhodococcus erythropolis]|uniref:amino acid adenylation domain-containing protein n=1 Tax=Rhodococcus erythropolis TaxID=1833 RepID=UPI00406BA37F
MPSKLRRLIWAYEIDGDLSYHQRERFRAECDIAMPWYFDFDEWVVGSRVLRRFGDDATYIQVTRRRGRPGVVFELMSSIPDELPDSWLDLRAQLAEIDAADEQAEAVDLANLVLPRVNLAGARLRYANLSGADLTGADLSGADLSGADLSGADLSGADLSGADLTGANLSGADLSGADLTGANLSGADLADSRIPPTISSEWHSPLEARERPLRIPLSSAQQRMWFLNRFDATQAFNSSATLRLRGKLDIPALHAAINDVVARHEILRTIYPDIDGVGTQVALPPEQAQVELTVTDIAESAAFSHISELISVGFDVTTTVPVRADLLRLVDDNFLFVVAIHHISADCNSMTVFTRDMLHAYTSRIRSRVPEWEPLSVQYADFALWQRAKLGSEADPNSLISQQISYWTDKLAGMPDQIDLPLDKPRPSVASNDGATYTFTMGADLQESISGLARNKKSTDFMVMQAALAVLLSRLSNTRDIVIGTAIAGRGDHLLDDLVGVFTNSLVLRTEVDLGASFTALLADVGDTDVSAFSHSELPFDRLIEELKPARTLSRHPLFQVTLFTRVEERNSLQVPDVNIERLNVDTKLTKFDLAFEFVYEFNASGDPAGLLGHITYATDLFRESTVASFAERMIRILESVVAEPDQVLGNIPILNRYELGRILHGGDDTEHAVADRLLQDSLVAQAKVTPDATAVVFEGASLTYGEFADRVNRLARKLIGDGVGPGVLVALTMPRSLDLVLAMYAVLTAGGAYVSIDPDHPAPRRAFILDTVEPVAVLSYLDSMDLSEYSGAEVSDVDRFAPVRPDDLACVFFTSGSTGSPKGVAVTHGALVNQMAWMQDEYRLTDEDIYLQKTSAMFDLSTWGFFMPLRVGATLALASPDGHRDPAYIANCIRDLRVTVTDFVPSMLAVFSTAVDPIDLVTLKQIFVAGEALTGKLVQDFVNVSSARVHNLYGPTEAAVSITHADVTDVATDDGVPIGGPGWNCKVYVLDERLHPVPLGVSGELYLAGAQLARGYIGQPGLTAGRFVANPFGEPGVLMYRTGDLASWRSGDLHYLGRNDLQVKLRGHRIELGEVEAHLAHHLAVAQSVVLLQPDAVLGGRLVAYIVPSVGYDIDLDLLKEVASEQLPRYMVPSAFVLIDELPLTLNGKLDRRALPVPAFEVREFRAPSTLAEKLVATAFADVLGVERVGLDDDFFELGGNSLAATVVIARIKAVSDYRLSVATVFEASSVRALAAWFESQ